MSEADSLSLYIRHGCHLCEDMLTSLRELPETATREIVCHDIDRDPALRARYDTLVPVLCYRGREICHYFLDLVALREALAAE